MTLHLLGGAIPYRWDRSLGLAWMDAAGLDLDRSFLDEAARAALARDPPPVTFATGLEALLELPRRRPAFLLFSMGRAGSTLLTRLLARPSHLACLREPGLINDLLLDPETRRPDLLAGALSAIGGASPATPYLVKLSSWNLLYADLLAAASPATRILLLRRDPEAILASFRREPPAWAASLGVDDLAMVVAAIAEAADALEQKGAETCDHDAIPRAAARLATQLGLDPLEPEAERAILAMHARHPQRRFAAGPAG